MFKVQSGSDFVVQDYIANPLLIEGKKFDCRMYVLVVGLNPICSYVCKEGLARFCTENYEAEKREYAQSLYAFDELCAE